MRNDRGGRGERGGDKNRDGKSGWRWGRRERRVAFYERRRVVRAMSGSRRGSKWMGMRSW